MPGKPRLESEVSRTAESDGVIALVEQDSEGRGEEQERSCLFW